MARRVYFWDPHKSKLRQEALLNMRTARRNIDPALMEVARQALADGLARARDAAAADGEPAATTVPVDRQKNMSIIMQFIEMKRDDQALLGKIKMLLSDV